MQGTQVQSLVQEDPTCQCAATTEPMSCNDEDPAQPKNKFKKIFLKNLILLVKTKQNKKNTKTPRS